MSYNREAPYPQELVDPVHTKMRDDFDTHIADRLGAALTEEDLDLSNLTPNCVYYEDDNSPISEGSPDKLLPMPEGSDNYVMWK